MITTVPHGSWTVIPNTGMAVYQASGTGISVSTTEHDIVIDTEGPVRVRLHEEPEPEQCTAETWSWDHFNDERFDGYWIRCTLWGAHDDHQDEHTGLSWTASSPKASEAGRD